MWQAGRVSKIRGVHPAIVVDNKDGDGNPGFRVKLKLPWLNDQETTFWARIAVPMAGPERGTYVLPEIDDQVLVVFEHGDIGRPIVVGALWSRKQEPVEVNQSGKNNTKLIKSRAGHRIIFDDREGAEKIVIVDKTKKNKIILDSVHKIVKIESDGDIEVKAKTNIILHSNALKVGTTDGVTGKGASLLVHSQKTFGLKASSGITIGGGNTTINVSNAAATSVSGSGTGDLGGAAEPGKDQGMEPNGRAGGGGAGGSSGSQAGGDAGTGSGGPRSSGNSGQTAPGGAPPAPIANAASTPIAKDQIEVQIVNALGHPQQSVSFDLEMPDGTTKSGSTAADGFLRFSGIETPGTAKLVLPEHDPEKGSASGPHTSGAQLYGAGGVDVAVGQASVVELRPRVYRGRLTGFLFDTDRTFVTPGALEGIRLVTRMYDEHSGAQVLVSGHADTVGGPQHNRGLSSERAEAVAAFLKDDVDAWLAWYQGKPSSHAWGTREDQYMLATIKDASGAPFYAGPVGDGAGPEVIEATRRYQQARGLTVNGVAGPQTRRALITDYMATDGTTLPAGTVIQTHGCGESHPADPIGDNQNDPENRRVELFFFEGPIDPAPVASCPIPSGCAEYDLWKAKTVQSIELRDEPASITVTVIDENDAVVDGATVHASGPTSADATTSAGGATITDIAAGHYVLVAKKQGFLVATAEVDAAAGGASVQINMLSGIDPASFTFDVTVDDDDQPLPENA